jgi:hypothetical protein
VNTEAKEAPVRSSKDLIWVYLCWFAVIVALYILSIAACRNTHVVEMRTLLLLGNSHALLARAHYFNRLIGPVMKITNKIYIYNPHPAPWFFTSFYKPLEWAYYNTLLHKPLGLYYHLWIPSTIDNKGNIIQQ